MPGDRPILFSSAMVRAILAGRKTMTRRVMRPQPPPGADRLYGPVTRPYGAPGDRLWVRETWAQTWNPRDDGHFMCRYRAGDDYDRITPWGGKWRPSIHMPRWASRLTLEVEEVRVQRLQEISEEDARAEGICLSEIGCGLYAVPGDEDVRGLPTRVYPEARLAFACLWDRINAERGYPWASSPWVWCVTFRRVEADNA